MSQTTSFAAAFAEAFRTACEAHSPGQWTIAPRPDSQLSGVTASDLTIVILMQFQGDVEGGLYFCPDPTCTERILAGRNAGTNADSLAAWQTLCQEVAPELSRRLQSVLGDLQLAECVSTTLPQDVASVGDLEVRAQGAAPGTVGLLCDARLRTSLTARGLWPEAASSVALANKPNLQGDAPLDRVIDVPLAVTLRFGQRQLTLREVLELNTGSLVELDQQVEEPVHLMLGDRVIARGEVVIVDGNYGMRVTEVVENHVHRLTSRP